MTTVDGGPVRAHVQAFADAINDLTGITHIMTYAGHQPTQDRALDIFATREQGDAICEYALAHWQHYGLDYWIWRQRIRNPPDRNYWREMEDRGGITANHFDHVHVSFELTGAASPGAPPTQEDDMFEPIDREALRQIKESAENAEVQADAARKIAEAANAKLDKIIAKLGA